MRTEPVNPSRPPRRALASPRPTCRVVLGLCCALVALGLAHTAHAQLLTKDVPQIQGVRIDDQRGTEVPKDLVFLDAKGNDIRTSEWFDGKRPVILIMAYYTCPLLCPQTLNRAQRALNTLAWTAGKQYRVITVSFDFRDTPKLSLAEQETYLAGYNRSASEDAWMFLTGTTQNIRALTDAVGYHFKYIPESDSFSHPTAMIILSPDGNVHNYLEKLDFPAAEVKQALTDAAEGKIGTIFDRIQFFCWHYDANSGQYTARVMNIMRVGAISSFLVLAGFVGALWLRRGHHRRLASGRDQGPPTDDDSSTPQQSPTAGTFSARQEA